MLFLVWPVIYMFITSFFDTSIVKSGIGSFAGAGNYAEMLSKPEFWSSLWHTIQFTLYTVPPLVILAFVFALLANRVRRGQWFFLARLLPAVRAALCLDRLDLGLYLHAGDRPVPQLQSLAPWHPLAVLGDPNLAMIGIALTTVWWTIGFNFVLYLAGLQDIPRELYEAAAVDGATSWQQIRFITIPLLSRTTTLVVLLQVIASLQDFRSGLPDDQRRPWRFRRRSFWVWSRLLPSPTTAWVPRRRHLCCCSS